MEEEGEESREDTCGEGGASVVMQYIGGCAGGGGGATSRREELIRWWLPNLTALWGQGGQGGQGGQEVGSSIGARCNRYELAG